MSPTLTLQQIAELVEGTCHGDPAIQIHRVATLTDAGSGDITWAAHRHHYAEAGSCGASAILVGTPLTDVPIAQVVCNDVEWAVAKVLEKFAPPLPTGSAGVHATAIVAPSAVIGERVSIDRYALIDERAHIGDDTVIGPGVHIGSDVVIGEHCRLWDHVVVRERCRIGNRVIIHPNAVIGADGFGYLFRDGAHRKIAHLGNVVICDDVEIGAGCCIDRAKTGSTVVEVGVKIDNLVQVAHNVTVGEHSVLCAQVGVAGSAKLGRMVVLGGQAGIRDNIVLHDGVMVGACSCVPQDLPAGMKVAGVPAVESRQFLRQNVNMRRLPELLSHLRDLCRRIERLEASANDQPRGRDGGSGAVHR